MVLIYIIILVVVCGAGAFMAFFGYAWTKGAQATEQLSEKINAQGVNADAEIVNHQEKVSQGARYYRVYYYLTYKYTVPAQGGSPEQILTSESQVSSDDYRSLKLGDPLTVRYLPDDPKQVRILSGAHPVDYGSNTSQIAGIVAAVAGVVVIIAGIGIVIWSIGNDNQKAAAATAVSIQESQTPNFVRETATAVAATATNQADTAILAKIQTALTPRITDWRKVTDKVMHRVLPPETGLNMDELEIDYGYCEANHFYVYAWTTLTDRANLGYEIDNFFDGYGYVDGSTPPDCYPKELSQVWNRDGGSLGNGWFAVSGALDIKTTKQP